MGHETTHYVLGRFDISHPPYERFPHEKIPNQQRQGERAALDPNLFVAAPGAATARPAAAVAAAAAASPTAAAASATASQPPEPALPLPKQMPASASSSSANPPPQPRPPPLSPPRVSQAEVAAAYGAFEYPVAVKEEPQED